MDVIDLEHALREHGYRVTHPRRVVWRALHGANGHVTVEELARDLADQVDVASIYRALGVFEELGLARVTRFGDEDAGRWEPAHPDEQFHLVCSRCGTVDHHVGTLVASISSHLGEHHDFEVENVALTVTGRCARCRDDDGEPVGH